MKSMLTKSRKLLKQFRHRVYSMPLLLQKKISITQEELNTELQNIAQEEEEDPEEFMATLEEEDVENIADQLTMDKTMAFILDSVVWDD
ncbi:MAG: hypothetical protein ACLUD0_21295 [Eubacterium ramulus]